MRFVPLLSCSLDPTPWRAVGPLALSWEGIPDGRWEGEALRGLPIHTLHLPGKAPVAEALEALQRRHLGPDFLVIPVAHPGNREAGFRLLGDLEALLEATSGRGVKLALRIEAGATAVVLELLRQARCEAVGFCWHAGCEDLEALADRLWTGVCEPGADLRPLQRLGYRWDMALPATDPAVFRGQAAALEAAHPAVLFPAELPATALGRAVVPDPDVVLGEALGSAMSGTLLVIAGEDSGDLHGAELLRELKARRPDLRIVGVGGPRMSPFLDRKLADVKDLAVVGFVEVIKHLPSLNRLFKGILAAAAEESITDVLLIDYPGFNLRLAKALRKRMPGIRLHQYVCPQVWAWKKGRIPDLGRTLDTLYCLFDFEPALFAGYPVDARFVGHPLVEVVQPECDRETFFAQTGLDLARPLVALLPGSRKGEVASLLPPMAELVRRWERERPGVQWVLPVAPTLDPAFIRSHLGGVPVTLVEGLTYAARAYADAALVASGTATLETALLGTPFAILYKLNPLTYQMAKRVVKLPHIGLANVVARREVAPELLQGDVNPERLGRELARLLDPETARRVRAELGEVRTHLGAPGAAGRVAEHLAARL